MTGQKGKSVSIKGYFRLSYGTAAAAIMFALVSVTLQAQAQSLDPSALATKLGEAAAKSNAAAYMLGFVCVMALVHAIYSQKKRDESTKSISDLTASIDKQTAVIAAAATAANKAAMDASTAALTAATAANLSAAVAHNDKADSNERALGLIKAIQLMAIKPCALDSEIFNAYMKGKLDGGKGT